MFDLKRDVTELKKLVLNILQNDMSGNVILQQNKHLFQDDLQHNEPNGQNAYTSLMLPAAKPTNIEPTFVHVNHENNEKTEDISHEIEDTLSLEKKEKEMIIRALKKNHDKRKYAAQDLGISERTLYRKIKQYNIEEE